MRVCKNHVGVIDKISVPIHQKRSLKMSRRISPMASVPDNAINAGTARVTKTEKPNNA